MFRAIASTYNVKRTTRFDILNSLATQISEIEKELNDQPFNQADLLRMKKNLESLRKKLYLCKCDDKDFLDLQTQLNHKIIDLYSRILDTDDESLPLLQSTPNNKRKY